MGLIIFEQATNEGAVHRLRPKLMTMFVVILSLALIFFEAGSIGNDVMEPIAVRIVGAMVTSSIAVLILLPVLFAMIKELEVRQGTLRPLGGQLHRSRLRLSRVKFEAGCSRAPSTKVGS